MKILAHHVVQILGCSSYFSLLVLVVLFEILFIEAILKDMKIKPIFAVCLIILSISTSYAQHQYPWKTNYDINQSMQNKINTPEGFERIHTESGSFEEWLRYLPLKNSNNVLLYDGSPKANQNAHFSVIDMDIGTENLQQCADVIIRLRAEYFYLKERFDLIGFDLTNGEKVAFCKWIEGYRPTIKSNRIRWKKIGTENTSYNNFRKYLKFIFMYAGTHSLSQELKGVKDISDMKIGDVFIQEGFPGHAVIVVDMAKHIHSGEKLFLLAQSFMPAQECHILKNLSDERLSPWYEVNFGDSLSLPEWTFQKSDLKRF